MPIVPCVHYALDGFVKAYLVETPQGLVLIDAGMPGSEKKILAAMRALGYAPSDLKHVVCTHAHADHMGGLGAVRRLTGAETWIHAADAPIAEGAPVRPVRPAPGFVAHVFYYAVRLAEAVLSLVGPKSEPARIDHRIQGEEILPFGLKAIPAPGHCAGQVALLWPERGLLFAADSAANICGPGVMLTNEDTELARRSFREIAALDFDVALFGHGAPILEKASERLREAVAKSA